MAIDVDYHLGKHPLLRDFERQQVALDQRTTPLIAATAAFGRRARRYCACERAAALQHEWERWLAYRYAEANVVTRTADGHLHLYGVTQLEPDHFYVTLHLAVAPEPAA
jgi:hypothetical protein